jgi:RNA polymerase sigma factor (sigma-70 family)
MQQNERFERVGGVRTTAASTEAAANEAFEALYRMHYPTMMRLGYLLTGSNEVAEDLVHDVFVRAQARMPLLHPASYLRASVVNACRSHHRRAALARRRSPPPAPLVMPRELVEFRDLLLGLPVRQRAAVVLRYFCDLGDADIAELLSCRPATVRSLVHRGLANLREVME